MSRSSAGLRASGLGGGGRRAGGETGELGKGEWAVASAGPGSEMYGRDPLSRWARRERPRSAEPRAIRGPGKLTGTERLIPAAAAVVADGAAAVTVFRGNFIFLLKLYLSINIEIILGNVREEEDQRGE